MILINKTNLTQEQKYSRNLFLLSILMKLRMKKIWSDLIQSFTQWEVKIKGPMYHNCLERDYMNTFKIFLYPISNKQMIVTHSNTYFVKLFYWKKKEISFRIQSHYYDMVNNRILLPCMAFHIIIIMIISTYRN